MRLYITISGDVGTSGARLDGILQSLGENPSLLGFDWKESPDITWDISRGNENEHKLNWEMTRCDPQSLGPLLDDGWEPFAVVENMTYLKRFRN